VSVRTPLRSGSLFAEFVMKVRVTTRGVNLDALRDRDSVRLPLPPSVNNLFATVQGRRVKSAAYRAWLGGAVADLSRLRKPERFPVRFCFAFGGDVNESRDGDNLIKPLLDACVKAGVIPGDSLRHVRGWRGEYQPGAGDACVKVWFELMPGGEV
jgi:hypothetical protein